MLANPEFRIFNNWLHDTGTGLWAGCLIAIWFIDRQMAAAASSAEAADILLQTQWVLFWVLAAALVLIAVTGAVRLLYWRASTPPEELPAKRPALIGKHVVYLVVYGGGTVWALWMLGAL